jgi:L-threonylcarbamoyladenylate synthase
MSTISSSITDAIAILNNEGIIAIPTETVYGLAGNIYSQKAIESIFELKQRPHYNPLIVHLKSVAALEQVAIEIPEKARQLAEAFWPGPLTLVLKKQAGISDLITAGKDTVAVRVPNHPVALQLLEQLDFPLAAPSANPFKSISPTQSVHVANYFGANLPMILEGGACESGIESTIIGFENEEPVVYRLGATSLESIELVVGALKQLTHDDTAPVAPGMLSKHYAPLTATYLTEDVEQTLQEFDGKRIGVLSFSRFWSHPAIVGQEVLSPKGSFDEAASRLYAALHNLDAMNVAVIIAEKLPNIGLGNAINDKLQRASKK